MEIRYKYVHVAHVIQLQKDPNERLLILDSIQGACKDISDNEIETEVDKAVFAVRNELQAKNDTIHN